ncbi:inositol 2-dehydrogenase [Burkholderia ambifaria]|uniref:inositol 2-dehydrogenase n=1 Tax=Burkholderia ambifaria TaxID=152480 RepID=UPI0013FDE1F2|nr:inositol 2-dehydrogenase [Burkholderia ambifaria]MBR8330764.1 inositol 2-dehydrogenase [Burkholderia ambifaria]MBR8342991.1 inositol 2-dehydrogenase [Burkholderia ambifaria]NHL68550.1 inositol 2-dehydrogenase [Burkholderia ambifaria]
MLRIAVLGAGRIGRIHAANVASDRRVKLVVVADPNKEAAQALATDLECDVSVDCKAVVDREDVDAVVVGTPTDTHIDLTLQAVRLGKPVLCEKPIDLDIDRALAAVEEIERLQGRVMLAFNRRFDPDAMRLKQAIEDGEVGDVRQVIITSRDPGLAPREYLWHSGGIFRDMTIHDFDTARWLLGEDPVEVMAIGNRLVDPTLDELPDYDSVMVLLRTASGKQCHINGSRQAVYGFDQRVEVFGSKGMVLNENHRPSTLRRWTRDSTEAREPLLNFFLERHADSYKVELDRFLTALETGAPMPATPRDGIRALRIANCALEAAYTGCAVKI